MKQVYNPGCALMIYKPGLSDKVLQLLNERFDDIELHSICCRHEPMLPQGTRIINTCAGCDRRFRSIYEGISTISLWEILADDADFPFPDYNGLSISIHDPCPVRERDGVHDAVRQLLARMNINIIEADSIRSMSTCCGDSFYPELPDDVINEKMIERADEMPCGDVCVYCVSCVQAMNIGGKKPRYILDLLFNEPTVAMPYGTKEWHDRLDGYIEEH